MKQKDHFFKFACVAIVVGLLAAFATAIKASPGLQSDICAVSGH